MGTGKCVQISMQVGVHGEASLKQGGNVHLGLSCFGGQAGSGVWGMAGMVTPGHPRN